MCSLHVLNKRPTPCFLSLACPRNPIPVKTRPVPLPVLRPPRLCLSLCQFSLSLAKRRLRKSWTCWLPGYLGNQALMSLKPCKSTWALHWGCFSLACVRRNSGTVYYNIPFFPLCDLGDWFLSLSLPFCLFHTHIISELFVVLKFSIWADWSFFLFYEWICLSQIPSQRYSYVLRVAFFFKWLITWKSFHA